MRTTPSFRILCGFGLSLFALPGLHAQSTISTTVAVHIADLTSEERDAVAQALEASGEARMVFACVPAGVMVFAPKPDRPTHTLRSQSLAALHARMPQQRIQETALSLADAEAACDEARNR
ncbi:MAG: hypothetical protein IPL52_12470 [Flavobacteriales bacterium]|nr:hypothetical protein [Flavobacteriales bacterium]